LALSFHLPLGRRRNHSFKDLKGFNIQKSIKKYEWRDKEIDRTAVFVAKDFLFHEEGII